MSESEFVRKVKALPLRERKLWFDLTIGGSSIEDVAEDNGVTPERAAEMLEEINRRLASATPTLHDPPLGD